MQCPIREVLALEALEALEESMRTLEEQQSEADFSVVENGIYQHFKGGIYQVLTVAVHTEDDSPLVIYRSLSDNSPSGQTVWARPVSMFCGPVFVNGVPVPRFRLIGIQRSER